MPESRVAYLKLYFSNSEGEIVAVERSTTREDVATFLVEEYMKGPNTLEPEKGYSNSLFYDKGELDNCGNDDERFFNLSLENQVATIDFCGNSIVISESVEKELDKTLTQFSTIDEVIIKY
ncbi:MAG: GerMN domain-containing protein [Candidatus Dojkabacteria bacterium]|nr:GerMN domain-containing protein [Candidatus Dojkabacteria bacterium]